MIYAAIRMVRLARMFVKGNMHGTFGRDVYQGMRRTAFHSHTLPCVASVPVQTVSTDCKYSAELCMLGKQELLSVKFWHAHEGRHAVISPGLVVTFVSSPLSAFQLLQPCAINVVRASNRMETA